MAIINEEEIKEKEIIEVACGAAVAAKDAPQITGKTEIHTKIFTGEDIKPMVEMLKVFSGERGERSAFIYGDYLVGKKIIESGETHAVLLIGSKFSPSDLGWNCGACGFNSCAEFNKYVNENKGMGMFGYGPSCHWKVIDFGIALSQASAYIYSRNIDSRVQASYGVAGLLLDYLPGCDIVMGISIGPVGKSIWYEWYNRPDLKYSFRKSDVYGALMRVFPFHFAGFPGGGNPLIKVNDNWFWDPHFSAIVNVPEALDIQAKLMEEIGEIIMKYEIKKREEEEK